MNKISYIGLFISSLLFGVSCSETEKKGDTKQTEEKTDSIPEKKDVIDLSATYYLEGTWVDASGTMAGFHEKWVRMGDTLMQVIGYYVSSEDEFDPITKKKIHSKGDTSITEAIKVKMEHGNLHYIPKVEGQNNNEEVPFELGEGSTKDSLIFFNQNHDFPQVITYVYKNPNVLVYLKGVQDQQLIEYTLHLRKKE